MKNVVIVDACRTAVGKFGGSLKPLNVADLAAVTAHINGFKALGAADAADVNNDGAVNVADAGIISASIKGVRALG